MDARLAVAVGHVHLAVGGFVILLIAVAYAPYYARLARAQTLAAKQNPYVKAERALGPAPPGS